MHTYVVDAMFGPFTMEISVILMYMEICTLITEHRQK